MSTADLTAEQAVEELREQHWSADGRQCDHDGFSWPCQTARILDRVRPSDAQPAGRALGYAVIRSGLVESVHRGRPYVVDSTLTVVPLYAHPPTVQPTVDREELVEALHEQPQAPMLRREAERVVDLVLLPLLASPSPQPERCPDCLCRDKETHDGRASALSERSKP